MKPELALSLEEILKPFAGLSQLLNFHDLTTLDDLNNLIHKAAEELEAMREDKLNDGRRLGPLQVRTLTTWEVHPCSCKLLSSHYPPLTWRLPTGFLAGCDMGEGQQGALQEPHMYCIACGNSLE